MHPVLVLATAAAGLYGAFKIARHIRSQLRTSGHARKNATPPGKQKPRDLGNLTRDPQTGVYHPHTPKRQKNPNPDA